MYLHDRHVEVPYQRSFSSLVGIVLKSHFQGNLYSDTSGIRKEAVIRSPGEIPEALRKVFLQAHE